MFCYSSFGQLFFCSYLYSGILNCRPSFSYVPIRSYLLSSILLLALLKLLASHDDVLRDHLQAPSMQNATYTLPKIQNDLIDVMAKQILDGIIDEVNESPYYSILAVEVTSHNIEYLSVCVRFLDQQKNIREEFLPFLLLERITDEAISQAILKFLQDNGIPASNIRGQGYDGTSNMSSDVVGVQAHRLKWKHL